MSTPQWFIDAIIYHVYPIGFTGVDKLNPDSLYNLSVTSVESNGSVIYENLQAAEKKQIQGNNRNEVLLEVCSTNFIQHLKYLGITVVYIGPLFNSKCHGYDTTDFFCVDKRLGSTNSVLQLMIQTFHDNQIRVVLDAVYNHVGRDFWAFQDVRLKLKESIYVDWFNSSLNDTNDNTSILYDGDSFYYDGWNGCYDLVKLNLSYPNVIRHLLSATKFWIDDLGIDGLRLDAADCVPIDFWKMLRRFVTGSWDIEDIRINNQSVEDFFSGDLPLMPMNSSPEFLLLGEITYGNCLNWLCPKSLFHSVTNYELWRALCSSIERRDMTDLAYTIYNQYREETADRLLGSDNSLNKVGYAVHPVRAWLYNFLDNHDVHRIASRLSTPGLEISIVLMYCLPGVPSIYYGSEFAIEGIKGDGRSADYPLRPKLNQSLISKAVNSTEYNDQWKEQEWNIYSLHRCMADIYHHPMIKELLTIGMLHIIHVSSDSLAFIRFLNCNKRLLLIGVCLTGSTTISIPISLLHKLQICNEQDQVVLIDLLDPNIQPSVTLDEGLLQFSVQFITCLMIRNQMDSFPLPNILWSAKEFKIKATESEFKIKATESKIIRQDKTLNPLNSNDLEIFNDLRGSWLSTFSHRNFGDIGQNIDRLFNSNFGSYRNRANKLQQEIDIECPEFRVDCFNGSDYFSLALVSIALCLPMYTKFKSDCFPPSLLKLSQWLGSWEEVLRTGDFRVEERQKDLLIIRRGNNDTKLFLCVYHPQFPPYSYRRIPVPFIPSEILRICNGQIETETNLKNDDRNRYVNCYDQALVVIAIKYKILNTYTKDF